MLSVHARLVMRMAVGTRKNGKIARILMAIGAIGPFVIVRAGVNGKVLRIVIPTARLPGSCIMAILASRWEIRCWVIGIGRLRVLRTMTGVAIFRCSNVAVLMAGNALRC